jgi:hypothetical protein
MSKSSKKNDRPGKGKTKETAGRMIALEGTRGKDLGETAQRLARLGGEGDDAAGFSRWDASNTFYELSLGKARKLMPTPRALLLLYVSDLLFRLRWEIKPALAQGRTVIVAPYVETAIGFGLAVGLPADWLRELFSFAPKPSAVYRLQEKAGSRGKPDKAASGFIEFCSDCLSATSPDWDAGELRTEVLEYFDDLEEKGEIRRLGRKAPKGLGKRRGK